MFSIIESRGVTILTLRILRYAGYVGLCWRHLATVVTLSFFFFQAEDGIRDYKVTGVQTCALPICLRRRHRGAGARVPQARRPRLHPQARHARSPERGARVRRALRPRAGGERAGDRKSVV